MRWRATGSERPVRSDCELDSAGNCVEPLGVWRKLMIRKEAGVESEHSPNTPDELYDVNKVSYIRTLHVVGDGMVRRYLSVS